MCHYECSNHPSNPNSSVILQNYILITLQYDIPDYMLWERFINWSLSYIIRDLQTWQHCIAMFTRRRQTCTFVISMDNLASFTVWSNRRRWRKKNNLPVGFWWRSIISCNIDWSCMFIVYNYRYNYRLSIMFSQKLYWCFLWPNLSI